MQFAPRSEVIGSGDQSWLGSAHATGHAATVTLDVAEFASLKATHGDIIPSGTPLKELESGLYGLASAADDELAGFLFTDQDNAGERQVAPMVWHGRIRANRLPDTGFDVSTLTTANPQFVIVKEAS